MFRGCWRGRSRFHHDKRPVSGFSKMKARTDQLSDVAGWRLHDLRRTARTGLAELGIPQIVAEKVLNHAERNQLVQTYDRHHYASEKRDALDRWANRLRQIVEPPRANLVRLTAGRWNAFGAARLITEDPVAHRAAASTVPAGAMRRARDR